MTVSSPPKPPPLAADAALRAIQSIVCQAYAEGACTPMILNIEAVLKQAGLAVPMDWAGYDDDELSRLLKDRVFPPNQS